MVRNFDARRGVLIGNIRTCGSTSSFRPIDPAMGGDADASPATLDRLSFHRLSGAAADGVSNVRLFDFRAGAGYHARSRQLWRRDPPLARVDLKVLSWLAAGDHRVDRAAPEASLDELKAQVKAYRVDAMER